MKRIFLLVFILFACIPTTLQAQEEFKYEETTWRIIRERLFNGNNANAYRYEKNIKIQLLNASETDSMMVKQLVQELNDLIETVEVLIVEDDGNMIINFTPADGVSMSFVQEVKKDQISRTIIQLESGIDSPAIFKKQLYYYCIKNLTKIYYPQNLQPEYGGIFDTQNAMTAQFHVIDKDIIRQLYSKDFYKNLRINTTKNYSYLHYLKLRYETPLKYATILFAIIISLLLFFYIYYRGWFTNSVANIKPFIYRGYVIVFIYSFINYSISFWDLIKFNSHTSSIFFSSVSSFFSTWGTGFIAVLIMYFIEKKLFKNVTGYFQKQVLIFFSTFFSILLILFILLAGMAVTDQLYGSYFSPAIGYFVLSLFFAIIRVFFNYLNHSTQSFINQKDVELAQMEELKNKAELNALHSRINPHFLYNSLNSIASLAHTNPDKTEAMAISLSGLFRYSINKEEKTWVTIEEEMEMVQKYLEVEKVRFGEKLDYQFQLDEKLHQKQIPKFLIQPLVENAIKHGISKITDPGILKIEIQQKEKDIQIRVFDNGPGFPEDLISGYGLQNLHDKLRILYGDKAILDWKNGENKFIQVTLKNQF